MLEVPGYRELGILFESKSSLVLRGLREGDSQPVILKMLKEDYPSRHDLVRYRQEYKITRSLAGRPGIIQTLGMEPFQNTFFIVLEDFGAEALSLWIKQHRFTLIEQIEIAIALTDALEEIHAAHVIHKDLNPGNVVYNPVSKNLKVIDFGISTQLSREVPEIKSPSALEGTLAYISPEQTGRMNRAVDRRTDFYSLGATLYELFTGRLPFDVEEPMELVHCHIARAPEPPYAVCPKLPKFLSDVLMKLLEKAPEDRYQSTFGLRADLGFAREQLLESGRITSLTVAQKDYPDQLMIPQKLYGREHEVRLLFEKFDQASRGAREMAMVCGPSGIGKTALVQELFRPLTMKRGYFISGKFDSLQRDQPYTAFSQAFRQLIRQLLTEPSAEVQRWQERLRKALGQNGAVIQRIVPEIELLLGAQPEVEELSPTESQNRFNLVFENFLWVFAEPRHPLVLFIDDLQWADPASLKLLSLILCNRQGRALYFIGAYRDSEVDPSHPLLRTLEEIIASDCQISILALLPFKQDHVNQLLEETLHCDREQTFPLAQLVWQKTQGNPLFVNVFLRTLAERGHLGLDRRSGRWHWNLAEIQAAGITDNVAAVMVERIQKLPEETQGSLRLAALLGNKFSLDVLALVSGASQKETLKTLLPALEDGIALPLGDEYKAIEHEASRPQEVLVARFRFAHDRLQQAAYSMIPREERAPLHWRIGQILLTADRAGRPLASLFDIVNHLNVSAAESLSKEERRTLAELNLEAGKRAKSSTAFEQAGGYLHTARALLGSGAWSLDHALTREVCEEAAEAAYLMTDFARMESLVGEVASNARSPLETIKVTHLLIVRHAANNALSEAIQIGPTQLDTLGSPFAGRPSKASALIAFLKTRFALKRKGIETLAALPEMTDPQKLGAMHIMRSIAAPAYFSTPNLMALLACEQVRMLLRHGNNPWSGSVYASFGLILCGLAFDIETSYRIGELALRLLQKGASTKQKSRTLFLVYTLIMHWKDHLRTTMKPLAEAGEIGLAAGDFEYAALSLNNLCQHGFHLGQELDELERETSLHLATLRRIKQKSLWAELVLQSIHNLTGRATDPTVLCGEILDERELLPRLISSNDQTGVCSFLYAKILLCLLFARLDQAREHLALAEKHKDGVRSLFGSSRLCFFASLVSLGGYLTASRGEKRRIRREVAANQKTLRRFAASAPMNHLHAYYLVEAERNRVLGDAERARSFYERAAGLARENGYLHEEGLACELAGRFHLQRMESLQAGVALRNARYAYLKWGASVKVDELDRQFQALLEAPPREASRAPSRETPSSDSHRTSTSTVQSSSMAVIDINAIIRAFQGLPQEVSQEEMLPQLMKIVQEHAGAAKVFLLLCTDGALSVEAYLDPDQGPEAKGRSIPLEECDQLSSGIVRYVSRTLAPLVLDDARAVGSFVRDPYVERVRPRSILCLPILRHGALLGVLYLENTRARAAFPPARVDMISLLAAQSAIVLANIKIYGLLRRSLVETREAAQSKIEFLARISHELKTPLNPIINYPEELLEKYKDLLLMRCAACGAHFTYDPEDRIDPQAACPACQAAAALSKVSPDPAEIDVEELLRTLKIVHKSGKHLLAVINDLLDLSKLEMGKMSLNLSRFTIQDLLGEVFELTATMAGKKNLNLLRPELPGDPSMEGDEIRLRQIFYNLLSNAQKFSPSGGTVEVVCEVEEQVVTFAVRDQGIGMSPDDQQILFRSFQQVGEVAQLRSGGTGLGLAITKSLVELHHGKIWVESEKNKGSTFIFRLPRWQTQAAQLPAPQDHPGVDVTEAELLATRSPSPISIKERKP